MVVLPPQVSKFLRRMHFKDVSMLAEVMAPTDLPNFFYRDSPALQQNSRYARPFLFRRQGRTVRWGHMRLLSAQAGVYPYQGRLVVVYGLRNPQVGIKATC